MSSPVSQSDKQKASIKSRQIKEYKGKDKIDKKSYLCFWFRLDSLFSSFLYQIPSSQIHNQVSCLLNQWHSKLRDKTHCHFKVNSEVTQK